MTPKSRLVLQTITDNSKDIIVLTKKKGKILFVNKTVEKKLGYKSSEIIDSEIYELIHPDSRSLFKKLFNELIERQNESFAIEVKIDKKGGETSTYEFSGKNFLKVPKIDALILTFRDITLQKVVEDQLEVSNKEIINLYVNLEKSQEELKAIYNQKEKIFSILSHDLRSPFSVLFGFTDILYNECDNLSPEEIRDFSNRINGISKRIFDLLDNLLEWSQIQTNKKVFNPEAIDISAIINKAIEFNIETALSKNIVLKNHVPENTIVFADKNMMISVFMNLISNAIKYSHIGGDVYITIFDDREKIEVSVVDKGIGILPERIPNILSEFLRDTTPGTEGERGSGLGLIICEDFVSKHGEHLHIESESGKGTTVSFGLKKTERQEEIQNENFNC